MSRLVEEQRESAGQLRSLAAAIERVENPIAALTERMERVEAQIAALTERMEGMEAQIATLTSIVERHTNRLAELRGWYLEVRARDRAPAIFGPWLDRV